MTCVLQATFIYVVSSVVLVVFNRLVHNFLHMNERKLTAYGAHRPSLPNAPVVEGTATLMSSTQQRSNGGGDTNTFLLETIDEQTSVKLLNGCSKEVCLLCSVLQPTYLGRKAAPYFCTNGKRAESTSTRVGHANSNGGEVGIECQILFTAIHQLRATMATVHHRHSTGR